MINDWEFSGKEKSGDSDCFHYIVPPPCCLFEYLLVKQKLGYNSNPFLVYLRSLNNETLSILVYLFTLYNMNGSVPQQII